MVILLKEIGNIDYFTQNQINLLNNGINMLRKGGVLIYCTCSLEPEEGENLVPQPLLNPDLTRRWKRLLRAMGARGPRAQTTISSTPRLYIRYIRSQWHTRQPQPPQQLAAISWCLPHA